MEIVFVSITRFYSSLIHELKMDALESRLDFQPDYDHIPEIFAARAVPVPLPSQHKVFFMT